MLTALCSFFSNNISKLPYVVIVVLGIYCYALTSYKDSLLQKYDDLNQMYLLQEQLFISEQNKSKLVIEELNDEINNYKMNIEQYTNNIKEQRDNLSSAYKQKEIQLTKQLKADDSTAKQMKLMSDILQSFSDEKN